MVNLWIMRVSLGGRFKQKQTIYTLCVILVQHIHIWHALNLNQLSCTSEFFTKLWWWIHKWPTHTLRTVFFFGDRSSTRFCDSIPDVFCRNRTRREGVGYCYVQLASLLKALWEPGQRCRQRWTQECHKHSQGKVTIMISEACTHKHPCIHTHIWSEKKPSTKGIYLLLVCDGG